MGVAGRVLIVLESVHRGNTARVAAALADVLGAEVVGPEDLPVASLDGCDLVGFGSGVYYGRTHAALSAWLGGLPDRPGGRRPAFIFSTAGLPCLRRVWHAPLARLLRRKGFAVVGEFSCRGFDTWGPLWLGGGLNRRHPDDRDLERARTFARGLIKRLRDTA